MKRVRRQFVAPHVAEKMAPEETPGQDVNDQSWTEHLPDLQVPNNLLYANQGHSHDGVRTSHGPLDLMQAVEDKVEEYLHEDIGHGEANMVRPIRQRPRTIDVVTRPAKSWDGRTYTIDQEKRIAAPREDRIRVVITNYGPGTVYLSHESAAGSSSAAQMPTPGVIAIPAPGPDATKTGQQCFRELRSRGEIYALPGTTIPIIDVQDEYGVEDVL